MNYSRVDISSEDFCFTFNSISRILYFLENDYFDSPYLRRYQKSEFNQIEEIIIKEFISDTGRFADKESTGKINIWFSINIPQKLIINFCTTDNFEFDKNNIIVYEKYPIFSNDIKYIFAFLPSDYKELSTNTKIEIIQNIFSCIMINHDEDDRFPYSDIIGEICANLIYNNIKISDDMKKIIGKIIDNCIEENSDYIKLKNDSVFSSIIYEYCINQIKFQEM